MKIRTFEEKDSKNAMELIMSILSTEFHKDMSAYPADDLKDIKSNYGGEREKFFVAEKDNDIIGTAAIKEDSRYTALLRRLFVKPGFRGKGYGKELLKTAIKFSKEAGYKKIEFRATSRMEQAILLCEKAGFSRKEHVNIGDIEIVVMSLTL